MKSNELTGLILGCAIEVHSNLGPGLLESTYEECLCHELNIEGLRFERQKKLPVIYKNKSLDVAYRLDIVVEKQVILELKSVEKITEIHKAQLLTYLKLSGIPVGFILNFNEAILKNGIKRMVYNF